MFSSFWMGGFETGCQINQYRQRLDMMAGVQHDAKALQDYLLLRSMGLRTVRDGARWHLIDKGGKYDFSSFLPMVQAALKAETQVIWTLCHYSFPDDVELLSPQFVVRFEKYCRAIAKMVREQSDEVPFYTPVNEISFFSWGAARDLIYPHAFGQDNKIKQQLIRATVAGCHAILDVDARARFVYPEPSVHVVAPEGRTDLAREAAQYQEAQYEAWDGIAGTFMPQLGGSPKLLDIVGLNFYHSNQWEHTRERLRWEDEPRDPRWMPLHRMIEAAWRRYDRPVILAETSHFGSGRARWIREIGDEVVKGLQLGVDLQGVCLYPILDRYDWGNKDHWHHSGLWDLALRDGSYERVLNEEYAVALREAMEKVKAVRPDYAPSAGRVTAREATEAA